MPINYSKYPKNWLTEIRPRILQRAINKCEVCGLKNGSTVFSVKQNGKTFWKESIDCDSYDENTLPKQVKVVLTIAHLDHDEENQNIEDDRLMAMCQLHHLEYDCEEKKRRKSVR